jgi:hypothetical protein
MGKSRASRLRRRIPAANVQRRTIRGAPRSAPIGAGVVGEVYLVKDGGLANRAT